MAILFLGDTHGALNWIDEIREGGYVESGDIIIQVGDFGFSESVLKAWEKRVRLGLTPLAPVYAIEGNHEDFSLLKPHTYKDQPVELVKGLFYIPRGLVLRFENKNIAFLGGAETLDRNQRLNAARTKERGAHVWFEEERILPSDVNRLMLNAQGKQIDAFVSHTPPTSVINACFGKMTAKMKELVWGLPRGWEDVSSALVERAYTMLLPQMAPNAPAVFGHMHNSKVFHNFRGLGNEELWSPPQWREDVDDFSR